MIYGEIAALTGALDGGRWARNMGIGLTLALGVLAFAVWQFRVYWRRYRTGNAEASTREGRYYRSQARRRLQIAALAGVVGLFMLAGMTIPAGYCPRLFAFSWMGVVLFGAWTIALAIADVVAIWFFFEEERQEHAAQSVALRYKMEKFQEESLRARDEAIKKAQAEEKEREEKE
ncbi:MAG: hypothetical protein ACI4NP_05525 [Thermoguttaceae bacterium]